MFNSSRSRLRKFHEIPFGIILWVTALLVSSILLHCVCIIILWQWRSSDICLRTARSTQFPGLIARPVALSVEDPEHYGLHADDEWSSSVPIGGGFLRLPQAEHEDEFFAVSVYHQLHCLNGLRKFVARQHNLTITETGHAQHCLQYLRQMILCHADITAEPVRMVLDFDGQTVVRAATGIGVTHECRDWTEVRKYLEEHYDGWEWEA